MNKPEIGRLATYRATLEAVCRVLKHGEEKYYEDLSWMEYSPSLDIDAIGRHYLKIDRASILRATDEETDEHHLIHLICRALFAHEKVVVMKSASGGTSEEEEEEETE